MLIKTDSQNYTNIANAIRELAGSTELYKPEQMMSAIDKYAPEYGISYDEFDSDGNVLKATTYGYKVTGLAGNEYLQTVNISENATEIGDYAFVNSGIINLELPSSIAKIGANAFSGSDLTIITLPDTITEIGIGAFSNCYNLVLNSLPLNVTRIEQNTFFMSGIKASVDEFIIHENIDYIGFWAFYGCGCKTFTFKGKPSFIANENSFLPFCAFYSDVEVINVPWSEGEVEGAPWGATNAIINYNYTESTEF